MCATLRIATGGRLKEPVRGGGKVLRWGYTSIPKEGRECRWWCGWKIRLFNRQKVEVAHKKL